MPCNQGDVALLERLAFYLIGESEARLPLILICFVFFVAFVTISLDQKHDRLPRAPYFALVGLGSLLLSTFGIVWIFTVEAMFSGRLWLIVLSYFLACTAYGVFLGRIACARSRDAFGGNGGAYLVIVPLVGLWLFFASSSSDDEPDDDVSRFFWGPPGVVAGFLFLLASGFVNKWIEQRADAKLAAAQAAPDFEMKSFDMQLRVQGVEFMLKLIESGFQAPVTIDEVTVLKSVRAEGMDLFRTFEVTDPEGVLSDQFKKDVIAFDCGQAAFLSVLRAGATFRERYVDADNSPIVTIPVTAADCN